VLTYLYILSVFNIRGRVRVQLKNDDGSPLIDQFPTRDAIILHVADMIPQLKSRTSKPSSGTSGGHQETQQASQSQGGKKNKKKK
jgi:signal recognition particle subunit SRP19